MKKSLPFILFFIFFYSSGYTANNDSIRILDLEQKINKLESNLKSVENNQLNYKIEKDLLKETYSNNYENINMIITIVLGIIGILGYLGIRDINSIKKEYILELNNFRTLKSEFEIKYKEFSQEKGKIDSEIKEILIENEKQNRKLKFLELKEKVGSLISNSRLYEALEFIKAALDINPDDEEMLTYKARTLCRLNQIDDSISIYKKLQKDHPEKSYIELNLLEMLVIGNNRKEYNLLIEKHSDTLILKSNGKLLALFEIIFIYNSDKNADLIQHIKPLIDFTELNIMKKNISDWDLTEIKYAISHQPDSKNKTYLQNLVWYLDGQVNTKTLCGILNIPINDLPKN